MIAIPTDPAYHRLFDALAWGAGLVSGSAVARWRLAEARASFPKEIGYMVSLGAGAVAGAYLAGSAAGLPEALKSAADGGSGFNYSHSVVGALAGAVLAVELYKWGRGIKRSTGALFVAPFAVGIVVGRWGCLFAGLADGTYGTPTELVWGVDLGDGTARHPVQIYESLTMLLFVSAYLFGLRARADWAMKYGFYFMVMAYGAQRFLWEFLKPYPALLGPFNLFHIVSLGLILYGWIWLARARAR